MTIICLCFPLILSVTLVCLSLNVDANHHGQDTIDLAIACTSSSPWCCSIEPLAKNENHDPENDSFKEEALAQSSCLQGLDHISASLVHGNSVRH